MTAWHTALREARRQRGLRQRQLAEQADVGLRTVIAYEGGTATPSRDTLLKLAAALALERQTLNAVLSDAGFDPMPTGRLARFERRSLPFAAMQREIDRHSWPCLVLSDDMTILLWNAPATWVGELDFAATWPDPADRTLMRVAALQHFRERVLNWSEVVSVMIAMLKADFEDPDRYSQAMPTFAKLVQDLSTQPQYQQAFPALMDLWQRVAPRQYVARTSFTARWQLGDGTALRFNCLISSWNDFDAAAALDWLPADGATAVWLEQRATLEGVRSSDQAAVSADALAHEGPLLAWHDLLRSTREKSGLTQAGLAEAIGVSEHTIFSYEKGRRRPSRTVLLRLARALHLDGATTNLLLTGAGHAPIASEIARSLAGLPSSDPRFPVGRWQALAEQTEAQLAAAIGAHAWPCLVLDERCRPHAANAAARRLFGAALDRATLLELLVSPAFRERLVNYDEVVTAIAPGDLRQVVAGSASSPRLAPLQALLASLADADPAGLARLRALWETASTPVLSTRATYPVVWQTEEGTVLTFHGMLTLWSNYLWYWALDWHPADAATWAWFA
jgi:transcriptional regulator with XRE-family HTH domain